MSETIDLTGRHPRYPDLPPWFALHRDVFGAVHLSDVMLAVERDLAQPSVRMFGRDIPVPRLVASYGEGYTYSGIWHLPRAVPIEIGRIMQEVRERCRHPFNSVLVNLYRDGNDSVSWHADDEKALGEEPTIASVSLGAPRRFSVRQRTSMPDPGPNVRDGNARVPRWDVTLEHGDVLIMTDRSQVDYQHAVHKVSERRVTLGPRINLTFRLVR